MTRDRLLGQARADLVALPDLIDQLGSTLADRHHDVAGKGGKIIGSPAPLSMPVVHLAAGGIHKPHWWGEDPRHTRWALTWYGRLNDEKTARTTVHTTQAAAWREFHRISGLPAPLEEHQLALARITPWRARDQYDVASLLEAWVRVLCDEWPDTHELTEEEAWVRDRLGYDLRGMPELAEQATVRSEAAVLIEHWDWITEQPWALELAEDITRITRQVRSQLGIRPEPEYGCPQCGNRAYLQPGGILACTEVQEHHVVVRDLEQQQRRRPPMTSKEIVDEFGITLAQLWQWKHRRKISPTRTERGKHWWLPWDVFCLVNPDIADAIERRAELDHDGLQEA